MKRILVMSFVLAVALALATSGMAMAAVIAQWNYNGTTNQANPNVHLTTASQALIGGASATYAYPQSNSSNAYSGDTTGGTNYGLQLTYGANPNTGRGVEWAVSTAGYDMTSVTFAIRLSGGSSSPTSYTWGYYGSDNAWHDTTFSYSTTSTWLLKTFDLTGIGNDPDFKFHLLAANGTSTTAYTYFDLVTFNGTPAAVPIPAAAWLLGSGLLGLVAIRRRMKK